MRRPLARVFRSPAFQSMAVTVGGMVVTLLFDWSATTIGSATQLDSSYPLLAALTFAATTVHEAWFLTALSRNDPRRRGSWFGPAAGVVGVLAMAGAALGTRLGGLELAALCAAAGALGIATPDMWTRAHAVRRGRVVEGVGIRYLPQLCGLLCGRVLTNSYLGFLAGFAIGAVLFAAFLRWRSTQYANDAPPATIADGGWLAGGSLLLGLTAPVDVAVAGTLGAGSKATYVVAARFAMAAVAGVVTPTAMALSTWLTHHPHAIRTHLWRVLGAATMTGLVLTVPLAVAAPEVVRGLLQHSGISTQLDEVERVARVLCLLLPVQILGTFASRFLVARGQMRVIFVVAAITLVVDTALDLALGSAFGVTGLAWASVGAWTCSAALLSLAVARGNRSVTPAGVPVPG